MKFDFANVFLRQSSYKFDNRNSWCGRNQNSCRSDAPQITEITGRKTKTAHVNIIHVSIYSDLITWEEKCAFQHNYGGGSSSGCKRSQNVQRLSHNQNIDSNQSLGVWLSEFLCCLFICNSSEFAVMIANGYGLQCIFSDFLWISF